MKLSRVAWWLPDPTLGTFGLFGSITSAFHKVENITKNIVSTITHPSLNTIGAFVTNPLGAQANAAITGPAGVNPKNTAILTAVGAGATYGASLALGPNLGVTAAATGGGVAASSAVGGAAVPATVTGSTVGAETIIPASTGFLNTGISDPLSYITSLGKGIFGDTNPAIAGNGTAASAALPDNGPPSAGMGWILGIGAALLVFILILRGR